MHLVLSGDVLCFISVALNYNSNPIMHVQKLMPLCNRELLGYSGLFLGCYR